jgi:hypothetical protein
LNNVLLLKISVKAGSDRGLFINSNSMYAALSRFLSSFVSVTTGDVKDENMMRSNETTNSLVLGYDIDSKMYPKKVSKSSYALLL